MTIDHKCESLPEEWRDFDGSEFEIRDHPDEFGDDSIVAAVHEDFFCVLCWKSGPEDEEVTTKLGPAHERCAERAYNHEDRQ